jgi:uncharacterized protein (TIGR03435 family)
MNAIRMLSSQPWVERLGWTLLYFLWQGIVLSFLYGGVRRWMARLSPNARYMAACLTLAAMMAAPIATFLWLAPAPGAPGPPPPDASARILNLPPQPSGVAVLVPAFANGERSGAWITQASPWIVAIWFFGAALCWLRLAGGWWVTSRIRSHQIRSAPREWLETLTHLCARIRLSRPVRLLVSARVAVPTVVGWFRPVVLVPLGALNGLPAEHTEALLLHELAHIRRHDYLVNVLQSVAESLLFYHPAVWWVSGHIRTERELCCDDLAVAATGDAFTYATALADLEACRPAHARTAVAANGGSLTDRIARLLGQSRPESRTSSTSGSAAGAVLLAVTACVVFGQSADRQKFEVASVKQNQDKERYFSGMIPETGGRLHAQNVTVNMLIMRAYRLQEYQILGGAAWLHDVGYDIEAKGGANATIEQMNLMLQPLLEDRFHLKFHRETRELPVFALTVTRGGSKLHAPKEGGCVKADGVPPPASGASPPTPCGSLNFWGAGANRGMRAVGGDVSMPDLIRSLSMAVGRPVLDRTGITTRFDVLLEFTPDDTTDGLMSGMGSVQGHRESMLALAAGGLGAPPNILTALQEQLGLKLDSTKGPVEVLVIDHVERPAEN